MEHQTREEAAAEKKAAEAAAADPKMKVISLEEFVKSELKLHELSRVQLWHLANDSKLPEFMKGELMKEFGSRIR